MITRVRLAFWSSGALKSATPSEIASSPVSDEPPFANARSRINIAAAVSSPCSCPSSIAPGKSVSKTGSVPFMSRQIPIVKTMNIEPTKK